MKGNPTKAKKFTPYTGNVKATGNKAPAGTRKSPAGGKVATNMNKKAAMKKPGNVLC